ncbi:MAG: MaoC family dehydratase [Pseudomonadota bacterium]
MIEVQSPQELIALTKESPLASGELEVSQTMINAFVALCGDKQSIHQANHSSPAVVPGNLLIALIPGLLQSLFTIRQTSHCYTAKYNKIRFLEPIYANDSIRLAVSFKSARETTSKTVVTQAVQVLRDTAVVAEAEIVDVYFFEKEKG